jgi:hypothetical protein
LLFLRGSIHAWPFGSRTHSSNATVTDFGPAFQTPYSISIDPDKVQDVMARLTLLLD